MTTCISPWSIFPAAACASGSKHPVSEADAVNYAHQIGEALQIVHAARVVHRDLKPSNLMLTNENRLVLIDFGSARTQFMAQRPDALRRLHRNTLLCVSGADRRPRTGRARRSLQSRSRAVRDALGRAALHRQNAGGYPGGAPLGADPASARTSRQLSADHRSPAGQGSEGSICVGRGVSRCPGCVARGIERSETQQATAESLDS